MALSVVYVGTLPPHPGGSAVSAALILEGLAARGHAVRSVAPMVAPGGDPVPGGSLDADEHRHPSVLHFAVPWFETHPMLPPAGTYRDDQQAAALGLLSRLVDDALPDVCFVGRESFAPGVPDLMHARGIPVVQRLAGGSTMGLAEATYPEILRASLLAALRQADVRVSPGRHLAAVAQDLGMGEVRVIPTAADIGRFWPAVRDPGLVAELGIPRGAVVVAHVSNLKPIKRPLDIVRSAVTACAADRRLLYLVVGDGHLRVQMEAESRAAGLADRFRFVGWRSYAEMPAYFALADMVVMPSEVEGLARTYVETQASGRVLIASDIPPAREVVTDGVTGLLFPLGDVDALAAATLRAARDPGLREAIGRQARERARVHDLAPAIDAYERLLEEAASRRRAAGRRRAPPTPLPPVSRMDQSSRSS